MFNHVPKNYKCPFCLLVNGVEAGESKPEDIFYKNEFITAFVSAKWWINNPGGTLVIPNNHFENLYDIDEKYLNSITIFSKKLAIALKEVYKCDGVSTRQHNEPSGDQEVWHFHLHVMPRWERDDLYINHNKFSWTTFEERKPYVDKLRNYFKYE